MSLAEHSVNINPSVSAVENNFAPGQFQAMSSTKYFAVPKFTCKYWGKQRQESVIVV
jgi:hypothetical protein